MANKKIKEEKKEVKEIYEVERAGKEKEVEVKGKLEEEHSGKKEMKKQERQLRIILIGIGIFCLFLILIFAGLKMIRNVNYGGVKYEVVQEGQLILYNTKVPVYDGDGKHVADYNFYLRTNPNDLESVPFEGELLMSKGYAMNLTNDFKCDGDGVIAFANLMKQQEVAGLVFINDKNATCDELSRYVYYEFREGNETKIVQRGNASCYDVYVSSCEILPATEKIMAEVFVYLKNNSSND